MTEYRFATDHFVTIPTAYQGSVLKSRSGGEAIVAWMTRGRALSVVRLLQLPVKPTAAWKSRAEEMASGE